MKAQQQGPPPPLTLPQTTMPTTTAPTATTPSAAGSAQAQLTIGHYIFGMQIFKYFTILFHR